MAYRTFNEWKARGRAVQKGEKALGFLLDGTAIFGKEQTKKAPVKSADGEYDYGPDSWYEGDPEWDGYR